MSNPSPPQIDVVTLAVAVSAGLFGPELAAVVAPYAVIIIASTLGAGWSAGRIAVKTRQAIVWHMLGMVGLALLVSVPLAEVVSLKVGYPVNWVLGPLAAGIGAVGPDGLSWVVKEVAAFAAGLLKAWIARRAGIPPADTPPGGENR